MEHVHNGNNDAAAPRADCAAWLSRVGAAGAAIMWVRRRAGRVPVARAASQWGGP